MSYEGFLPAAAQSMIEGLIAANPGASVGLLTELPAVDGTGGIELAADDYARQPCTSWILATELPEDMPPGVVAYSTTIDLTFTPTWPAEPPTIVGLGLWSAETGGTLLAVAPLEAEGELGFTPAEDSELVIRAGAFQLLLVGFGAFGGD